MAATAPAPMKARARSIQLPLALEQRPAYGREDFLVAESNRDALAWIEAWPDWPGRMLVLCGPQGSGKTHLAHVWRAIADAAILEAAIVGAGAIDPAAVGARPLVIEAVDEAADDVALFHAVNRAFEAGGYILATARIAPGRWHGRLADLVSRLRAAPTVSLGRPDDALIAAVLVKLLRDRQLDVADGVIEYLVRHMERSFEAARRTIADADALALAERRRVTVPLVRRVLSR